MRWIDGHLDLAYLACGGAAGARDIRVPVADPQQGCVSLPALRQARVEIAFATIFTEPNLSRQEHPCGYPSSADHEAAEAAGLCQMQLYEQLAAEGEVSIVRRCADLDQATALPKLVMLMEGADPIQTPEHVQIWFDRGVRIVGLTWAAGTRYAGGNTNGGPLTILGRQLVSALDAVSMIHDASHLSDEAFDDLFSQATGRIIASHSNCRALVDPKQRHLRDEQIKAIGDRNGIVGLNLYSRFLVRARQAKSGVGRRATIDDCIAHIEHVTELMGHRRGVALGSDMDGGILPRDLPTDLDHPSKLHRLAESLHQRGWSDDEIKGFAFGNWHTFLGEALPAS